MITGELIDNLDVMSPSSDVLVIAPDGSYLQIVGVEVKGMDVVILTEEI